MAKPDWQRILEYFRSRPDQEINAYNELVVNNLHILEYTGRISDARKQIGCNCGRGNPKLCSAGEHIINTRKGYYKYTLTTGGRDDWRQTSSTPRPSFVEVMVSKEQVLAKTKQRLAANPQDNFYQKLLNWQERLASDDISQELV